MHMSKNLMCLYQLPPALGRGCTATRRQPVPDVPADPGRLQRPRSCSPKPGLSVSVPPSPDREYGEPTLRPQSETLFLVGMTSSTVRPPRQPCHDILSGEAVPSWLGISKAPFYSTAPHAPCPCVSASHAFVRGEGRRGGTTCPRWLQVDYA